jgi:molybdenum cofactor cytidylyltransferase
MSTATAVVVLGTNTSTRMASPKQLASYEGKTLLEHAIVTAQDADCGPVIVVLGAHTERITHSRNIHRDLFYTDSGSDNIFSYGRTKIHLLHNTRWNEGQSSSLVLGVWASLLTNSQAALIMRCDQPWIRVLDLKNLIDAQSRSPVGISAAAYAQTTRNPSCFSRSRFGELLNLKGDSGETSLFTKYIDHIERVAMPNAEMDIDTPTDLRRLQDWWPNFQGLPNEISTSK